MILDAKIYERNQGMRGIPTDWRQRTDLELLVDLELRTDLEQRAGLPAEVRRKMNKEDKLVWQKNVRKRKQQRIRELLTALNSLSAGLFAAISVAERQISVLQDLHSLFLTSCRTKTKDHDKGYPLRQNPFYKNIASIPILSENSEQTWQNTLDTIDKLIRERTFFIKKVKELVENMDIRRKIVQFPHLNLH